MIAKKSSKNWVGKAIFGLFFGIISLVAPMTSLTSAVYADVPSDEAVETVVEALNEGEITGEDLEEAVGEEENAETKTEGTKTNEKTCKESLGALGWLVCPATGALSKAVDWLYEKIESILVLNPVEIKDGSPIYEVWKYMRGLTNVLFIIFLLIMVYSQVTGLGITNYGLKKTLPKLIVGAIVVNLSFVMCSLLVDVSNIVGDGLRDVFNAIEESTMATMNVTSGGHVSLSQMYLSLAGGTTMAVGAGVIAFETGAIWMMIPTVLGAIVAVVIGLVTIAMRQAVVALLIMIAPLAIVAYILPNTGKWFQQWKQLLSRMLVFYPMFSLLFGASSLAGWAIIASAKDGFFLLLGVAVQIFPLFFAWKLMSLSGTFLSTINARMHALTAKPLAANRAWADSHRELTRQKYLASNAYTPSLKLAQFLSDRKIARDETTAGHANTVKTRGQMYAVKQNSKRGNAYGALTRAGEAAYEEQARNAQYQQIILRHQNNMNKGGFVAANAAQKARIDKLDDLTIKAFDTLKMEQARTEKIDYDNAVGFHKRMEDAMNAHFDEINWNKIDKKSGNLVYKRHFATQTDEKYLAGLERYADAAKIMEGNKVDTQYAAAFAAHAYDTQAKIISTKFQKYFELTPPTKDVEYRLHELSRYIKRAESGVDFDIKAADNIDAIVAGMRVLNQRGDTDLVKSVMDDLLDKKYGGIDLGTHASQALAGFLMFDVGDNDPFLRRFGKYINLETANVYNENARKAESVTLEEYIKGYHMDYNPETGKMDKIMYAKKPMVKLLEGTSFDKVERTAFSNLDDSLKKAYGYDAENPDKAWDIDGWMKKRNELQTAIEPQFLSAVLKYLSGSEQMTSAVKFWTGYELKQKKDKDGNVVVKDDEPVYELTPVWNKGFAGREKEIENFYRKKTRDYIKDQTPQQIIQMRTDVRDAIKNHMLNAFLEDSFNPEIDETTGFGVNAEKQTKEFENAKKALRAMFPEKMTDAENKAYLDKLSDLEMDFAGLQIRRIIGPTGTLEQIYNTSHSSASNAAKTWNRKWLLLNNVERMEKEVEYYKRIREKATREEARRKGADDSATSGAKSRIYNEDFMSGCLAEIDKFYDDHKSDSVDEFYNQAIAKIQDLLKTNESLIEITFKDKCEQQTNNSNMFMQGLLQGLFGNLDNYPDA